MGSAILRRKTISPDIFKKGKSFETDYRDAQESNSVSVTRFEDLPCEYIRLRSHASPPHTIRFARTPITRP